MLAVVICGCSNGRDDFIGARVLDACNGSYPACNQTATCLIGEQSYVSGRFPGQGKVIVQTAEPSTVKVIFFFDDISAVGTLTSIVWNEPGCKANSRADVEGKTVATEANQSGVFQRQENLLESGDHLITFKSDIEATYLMKVEVTPTVL